MADGRVKADPCSEATEIAAPHQPNGKADLTAGRSRQELAQRHEIGIGMLVKPASLDDELLTEVSNVSDRPAKAADAEFAEGKQHFER